SASNTSARNPNARSRSRIRPKRPRVNMSSAGKIKGIPGAVRNVSSKSRNNPLRKSFLNTDANYSSRKPTYAEMVPDHSANIEEPQEVAPVVVNAGVDNMVPVHAGEGAAVVNHDDEEAEPVIADTRAGTWWWCTIL
uniref:Uncharacterized protein n=1 Tax=Aegilops tauschii subsp. strangulata TaxID=200361 RepID=A0A453CBI6_AEGTS